MGCNHDKGTSNACSSSAYQYGYRDPNANFRSIMAYNCNAGQCDNNAGGSCARVQRFSNTFENYPDNTGLPIGTPETDNARHINEVKATIAGYFTAEPSCQDESECPATTDLCSPRACDEICKFLPNDCKYRCLALFVSLPGFSTTHYSSLP